jgi:hypothetical protein
VPLVKPATTIGEVVPVAVTPPGEDVTVYSVIALPPSDVGAVKDTVASLFPAVASVIVGALGTVFLTKRTEHPAKETKLLKEA